MAFATRFRNNDYDRMFIFPEKICEGKKREVVVSSLEAGEAGNCDNCQEQFFYVLEHYILTILFTKKLYGEAILGSASR